MLAFNIFHDKLSKTFQGMSFLDEVADVDGEGVIFKIWLDLCNLKRSVSSSNCCSVCVVGLNIFYQGFHGAGGGGEGGNRGGRASKSVAVSI